jgi:hypothetical protein
MTRSLASNGCGAEKAGAASISNRQAINDFIGFDPLE